MGIKRTNREKVYLLRKKRVDVRLDWWEHSAVLRNEYR